MNRRLRTAALAALTCCGGPSCDTASPTRPPPPPPTPLAVTATLAPATPATLPARGQPPLTYVLVHGAWAGGWEWKRVGQLLQADGHTVYRPTLTGQGERVHLAGPDVDLNTHINDIVNTILFEDLHDVVLMGHSYGGMVITGVADRVPDRIKALVYVDAILPVDGESADAAMHRPRPATGPAYLGPPGGWPPPPGKRPPYIVPQPAKTFTQPISLKNPAARLLPVTYILTVDPGRPPERDAFYGSYRRAQARGWTTWIMEGDHVVQVSRPVELTRLLERAPAAARAGT